MAEVAAAGIATLAPIIGQLDFAARVARHAEKDQRELTLRHLHPPPFLEPEQLKKCHSGVRIGHADHGMQEFHFASLVSSLLLHGSSTTVTGDRARWSSAIRRTEGIFP